MVVAELCRSGGGGCGVRFLDSEKHSSLLRTDTTYSFHSTAPSLNRHVTFTSISFGNSSPAAGAY